MTVICCEKSARHLIKNGLLWLALGMLVMSACSPRTDVVESSVSATLAAEAPPTSVLRADRPTSTPVATIIPTTAAPPTITPTPVIEPTPTVDPNELVLGDLIFAETFEQAGPWAVGETDTNLVTVSDNVLTFTQKNIDTFAFRITGRQADDFYTHTSTQVVGPCRTNDKYGLIFRLQDGVNYNLFLVNCEKQFRLYRIVGGSLEALNDWTESEFIDDSVGAINVLGVRGRAAQLDLFINDNYIWGVTDERFRGGRFGIWIGSGSTTNFTVVFDDLEIYSLPAETPSS